MRSDNHEDVDVDLVVRDDLDSSMYGGDHVKELLIRIEKRMERNERRYGMIEKKLDKVLLYLKGTTHDSGGAATNIKEEGANSDTVSQ